MLWFGKRYAAPVYESTTQTETPVGAHCIHCEEEIVIGDDGFFYANGPVAHRECFLRQTVGSVQHQQKLCSCYVPGADGHYDENGMTPREAARAAVKYLESQEGKRMKEGDQVRLESDGTKIEGQIIMTSKNGKSVVVAFDGMFHGWVMMTPLYQDKDNENEWHALDGRKVLIRKVTIQ